MISSCSDVFPTEYDSCRGSMGEIRLPPRFAYYTPPAHPVACVARISTSLFVHTPLEPDHLPLIPPTFCRGTTGHTGGPDE
ncbi:hypothetical protein PIB30_067261, partial [Stylosanthes scabra]|nr:hypothetical protein [Stylosanthes scabra]